MSEPRQEHYIFTFPISSKEDEKMADHFMAVIKAAMRTDDSIQMFGASKSENGGTIAVKFLDKSVEQSEETIRQWFRIIEAKSSVALEGAIFEIDPVEAMRAAEKGSPVAGYSVSAQAFGEYDSEGVFQYADNVRYVTTDEGGKHIQSVRKSGLN